MQTDFEKKLELILRDAFKCIYDNAPKEAVSIYREVSKKVDMMSEDDRILWRALGLHYWGQMQMNFARNEIIIYRDRFLQRILSGISEINMVMDIVEIDE